MNKFYKNYSVTGKQQNHVNCQDFVEAILDKLDISLSLEGSFGTYLLMLTRYTGEYINKMKTQGKCNLEFTVPSKEFQQAFQLESKSVKFNTHQELDQFVHMLKNKNPLFHIDYPNEWRLLKAFDRAFWLKHLKNKCIEKNAPLTVEEEVKCPFGDPLITQSFVKL
jgi:hypothetical protein